MLIRRACRAGVRHIRTFGADARGATALEYTLIAGLIGLAIITAVTSIGSSLQLVFGAIADAFPH